MRRFLALQEFRHPCRRRRRARGAGAAVAATDFKAPASAFVDPGGNPAPSGLVQVVPKGVNVSALPRISVAAPPGLPWAVSRIGRGVSTACVSADGAPSTPNRREGTMLVHRLSRPALLLAVALTFA